MVVKEFTVSGYTANAWKRLAEEVDLERKLSLLSNIRDVDASSGQPMDFDLAFYQGHLLLELADDTDDSQVAREKLKKALKAFKSAEDILTRGLAKGTTDPDLDVLMGRILDKRKIALVKYLNASENLRARATDAGMLASESEGISDFFLIGNYLKSVLFESIGQIKNSLNFLDLAYKMSGSLSRENPGDEDYKGIFCSLAQISVNKRVRRVRETAEVSTSDLPEINMLCAESILRDAAGEEDLLVRARSFLSAKYKKRKRGEYKDESLAALITSGVESYVDLVLEEEDAKKGELVKEVAYFGSAMMLFSCSNPLELVYVSANLFYDASCFVEAKQLYSDLVRLVDKVSDENGSSIESSVGTDSLRRYAYLKLSMIAYSQGSIKSAANYADNYLSWVEEAESTDATVFARSLVALGNYRGSNLDLKVISKASGVNINKWKPIAREFQLYRDALLQASKSKDVFAELISEGRQV